MQILMSVPPTMEGVNSTVLTPLVTSTAAVLQATCWMRMDSTAMVRDSHYAPGRKIISPYITGHVSRIPTSL